MQKFLCVIYPSNWGERMKVLLCSFSPSAFQYHSAKNFMPIWMWLWLHVWRNGSEHCFNRTRNQSNVQFCQCSKGDDYGECNVAGGKTGDWKRPSNEVLWPCFEFPIILHVGEMLVGIKAWPGYIKSFIYQTHYSASVCDQYLIQILIIYPELCIFNVLYSY